MFVSLVRAALRLHVASALLVLCVLTVGGCLAGLPFWMPGLAWSVVGLGSLEAWYVVEQAVWRLRGWRPATVEEQRLLDWPALPLYVQEEDALRLMAGLRGMVVSRGALEVWEPACLRALLAQAQAAADAGPLLVGVGATPIRALARTSGALGQLGVLLAVAAGAALVVPLWLWGDSFTRVAGRVFGAIVVTILGFELIAGGAVVWGLGLLTASALAGALERLLAWEAGRVQARADRLVVQAGLGPPLLEALELLRDLGEPRLAPRIAALQAALDEAAG